MANLKYIKSALNVDQQIQFLIDQGLCINDREKAIHVLNTVSYYRFSAYLLPFKQHHLQNKPRQFKENSRFEEVWKLYQFDRELRLLISDAIEKIEIAFRAVLTNVTSIEFNPFWYVDRNYFKQNKRDENIKKRDFFNDFFETVREVSKNKQELFIRHYHEKYDEPEFPPFWMMVEALSFGACSKVYNNIKSTDVRKEIASFFDQAPKVIESWLRSLTYTRNLCAHHSRLWNRWFVNPPLIPKNDPFKSLIHLNGNYRFHLIGFVIQRFLEKIDPDFPWRKKLYILFEENSDFPGIEMGFKSDWKNDPFWKI